jgi:hypothetical protein
MNLVFFGIDPNEHHGIGQVRPVVGTAPVAQQRDREYFFIGR